MSYLPLHSSGIPPFLLLWNTTVNTHTMETTLPWTTSTTWTTSTKGQHKSWKPTYWWCSWSMKDTLLTVTTLGHSLDWGWHWWGSWWHWRPTWWWAASHSLYLSLLHASDNRFTTFTSKFTTFPRVTSKILTMPGSGWQTMCCLQRQWSTICVWLTDSLTYL